MRRINTGHYELRLTFDTGAPVRGTEIRGLRQEHRGGGKDEQEVKAEQEKRNFEGQAYHHTQRDLARPQVDPSSQRKQYEDGRVERLSSCTL